MISWDDILNYAKNGNPEPDRRVEKSELEWKEQLSAEEFRITRKKGTEAPGSSQMCYRFDPGIYACACCRNKLFDGYEKFESGTGWPSFTHPVAENAVKYKLDTTLGMMRVEAMCNVCDAHLGHVFPDGPPPTGLRYCMNAVSLKKID